VQCTRCKSDNPESNKFCGLCGAALTADPIVQAAVRDEIESRLRDRNVVEVEVAERVFDRLTNWGKTLSWLLGLNVVILGVTLSYWGITSFHKLLEEFRTEAKQRMEEQLKTTSEEVAKTAREKSEEQLDQAVTNAVQGFQGEIQGAQSKVKAEVDSANAKLEGQLVSSQAQLDKQLHNVQSQVTYLAARSKCEEGIKDFRQCHSEYPSGCSASGAYDAYLNLLKNRLTPPSPASSAVKYLAPEEFARLDARVPEGMTPGNHVAYKDELGQMGEGQLYGVIGYLYYVEHTGAESSNCDLTGPPGDPEFGNVDYQIGIGFDSAVGNNEGAETRGPGASPLQQTSMIVEMTPHYRFQFARNIWTLENLQKAVGRQVRVVGQLLLDSEHIYPSQNCAAAKTAKDKQTCWRASAWELHPVVRFQVCSKEANDCSPDDSAGWVELSQL